MIRWLAENTGLLILSLLIAMVVWIAAEWERDPIVEDVFEQGVPVQIINQPPGTHLVDGWQQTVQVRLRAPQSVWNQLRPQDFDAVLDLSPNLTPLEPGQHRIAVQVSVRAKPTTLLEVEPSSIDIELEAIKERLLPIQVNVRNEPELGYQAETTIVEPETVKVEGPASTVDRVVQVVTSVSLSGARETVREPSAILTPLDADGKRVTGVTLTPERVKVTVPVRQQSNFKEITVKPVILGEPAPDYYIADFYLTPPVVLVTGPRSELDNLPGFLTTVPISIAGQTDDIEEKLALELPPGVATISPSEPAVKVTIDIEPLLGSVSITRTVTFQGLRPSWAAIASPDVVEVLLSGPLARLSNLSPEEVRVVLDLSDMRPGEQQQLTPIIVQPEGISVDSVIPSVIQVEVTRVPTPTPKPQE